MNPVMAQDRESMTGVWAVETQASFRVIENVAIRWVVHPGGDTLKNINRRLAGSHDELLRRARANAKRLTGREVL